MTFFFSIELLMGNSMSQSFDPDRFEGLDHKNTRCFSLNGHKCYGRVVRVTDGDSLWVVIDFPEIESGDLLPTIFKCNMYGYDAPELNDTDPTKREHAQRCKEMLKEQVQGKDVWLEFNEPTSFERQSVNVFLLNEVGEPKNVSVNSILGD